MKLPKPPATTHNHLQRIQNYLKPAATKPKPDTFFWNTVTQFFLDSITITFDIFQLKH